MLDKIYGQKGLRNILLVVLLVGVASAGLGAFTFAYFQDTDTSSSNTIDAGTLNVTIDGFDDGTTSDFTMTAGQPLDSTSKNYTIRNGGSTAADHLQINTTYIENDPTGTYNQEPGDSDLNSELNGSQTAKYIEVTKLQYHNGTAANDLLSSISDDNNNGIKDLADAQNASALDDLTPPKVKEGNKTYFEVTIRIASDDHGLTDDDENIMGDGIDVKVHFTLMQDSSQDAV